MTFAVGGLLVVMKSVDDGLEWPGDAGFVAVPDFLGGFDYGLERKLTKTIEDLVFGCAIDASSNEEFTELDQVTGVVRE